MPQLVLSIEGVEILVGEPAEAATYAGPEQPHNDIVLADLVVSGEHCAFILEGLADVTVEDLRSTNGTYLTGQMVRKQKLRDHDVITVGRIHIEYLSAAAPGDFGQTTAMPLGGASTYGKPLPSTPACVCSRARRRAWRCLVVKAVTMFGKPGIAIVAISTGAMATTWPSW